MAQFVQAMRQLVFYFLKMFSHLVWTHRLLVSYGAVMFFLGVWAAGGFSSDDSDSQSDIAAIESDTADTSEPEEEPEDVAVGQEAVLEEPLQRAAASGASVAGSYTTELQIGKGDTFLNKLIEAGVSHQEAYAASHSLKGIYDVRRLKLGQKMDVVFDESADGDPRFVELRIKQSDSNIVITRDGENFSAKEVEKTIQRQMVRRGGIIDSSLYKLAADLDIPSGIVMEAIRAFSYDVDFQRDIQSGSRFEVLYETMYDDEDNKVRDGNLEYALLTVGGKALKIYRYESSKDEWGYYNEDGRSVRRALLRTPVSGARISSGFGMRRHPILGYSKMHKGVDFAAASGTPVYAAGDGTIEKIGRYGAYGKYVRIRHNGTYATAYAHLSNYAQGMKKGRKVKQGQVIAYVGTTGRATGPHLHYEVMAGGVQKNPLSIKMTPGKKLTEVALKKFKEKKHHVETLIASLPLETQLASRGGLTSAPRP